MLWILLDPLARTRISGGMCEFRVYQIQVYYLICILPPFFHVSCCVHSEHFPDLLARVCKAFVDSMWQHVNTIIVSHRECVGEEVDQQEYAKTAQTTIGCLSSIYGSLCGLHALGCGVTR